MKKQLKHNLHLIDKKLRFRLRIYFIIALALILVLLFNVIRGALRIDFGLLGLMAGTGVGIIASRMFHTSWDKNAKQVISRIDTFGVGILLLYIVFEILREDIVKVFTGDVQVATTGFAVLAGMMLGQLIGMRGKIIEVLKEQKVFGK